jgi:hypothetical protein
VLVHQHVDGESLFSSPRLQPVRNAGMTEFVRQIAPLANLSELYLHGNRIGDGGTGWPTANGAAAGSALWEAFATAIASGSMAALKCLRVSGPGDLAPMQAACSARGIVLNDQRW